ncbi:MAG: hypothetical protein IKQ04_02245 [Oscillospiraceae bacterium]|nr:hypothetical protein [Oscillospiraceae bacterium]
MRQPTVDYRKLRLSNLRSPAYRHLLLLGGWLVYFSLYFLTEQLIPYESCHVVHCALDDAIPFCEFFIVPYLLWFLLVAGSLLYLLLYDVPNFRRLSIYIMITQAGAMLVYILWPSIQLLRPETMPRENLFTWIVSFVYRFDTPTGILPSLHAAYSIAILSVFEHRRETRLWWRILLPILVVIIILATFFVKQHSVLDALAAIPLCLLGELLIYRLRLLQ